MALRKGITMSDIAKKLNISTVSVSKAIQNKDGVSDSLRKTILETADEMGYEYHTISKFSSTLSNKNIGILISERYLKSKQAFYWEICNQIHKSLGHNNFFGIVETISKDTEKALMPPQLITANKIDGIIVLGQMSSSYLTMIKNCNLPIVYTDFYLDNMEYDTITTDNFYSSYLITNYLIQNGHTEIGFLGDIHATSSILDRYLGYAKALLEHNFSIDPKWVLNDRDADGSIIAPKLPPTLPTAFVCNCDQAAYFLCEKLKLNKIKFPEEVSLVGFDNDLFSELCTPKLTTVSVDISSLASSTVSSIMSKITKNKTSVKRKVIPGNLVYRDSVYTISSVQEDLLV